MANFPTANFPTNKIKYFLCFNVPSKLNVNECETGCYAVKKLFQLFCLIKNLIKKRQKFFGTEASEALANFFFFLVGGPNLDLFQTLIN